MSSEPLLEPVMLAGKRVAPRLRLVELQKRCQSQLERLPSALRALGISAKPYPVRHSARLEALLEEVRKRIARTVARS